MFSEQRSLYRCTLNFTTIGDFHKEPVEDEAILTRLNANEEHTSTDTD